MFDQAYMCTGNRNLREIVSEIEVPWEMKYIGRKIIPERYNELFDHNGYYFENDQYDMYGIIANINPTVDEEGYITAISSYKVKDNTCGHGRPQTEDRSLGKKDISHFSKILDSVTVDHVGLLYDKLKTAFTKNEMLPGGYVFKGFTAKGVSLIDPSGEARLLSKAKILQALVVSQTFIDVLYSEATLNSAPKYFDPLDVPLYLAIFSKIDATRYRNYTALVNDANNRALLREAAHGYPAFVEAVKSNDSSKISELVRFAPLVIVDRERRYEPPIIIATRQNNIAVVRMLLENGAFSKEAYLDEQKKSVSPLRIAVQNSNHDMIALLCQYYAAEVDNYSGIRYDFWINVPQHKFKLSDVYDAIGEQQDLQSLKIILPKAALSPHKTVFNPQVFSTLTEDDVDFMISITGAAIGWPRALVEAAYQTNISKCRLMVEQGCELDVVDYFIECNDIELFEVAISHHSKIRPRPSFAKIYDRGGAWYQILKKASSPDFNYMELRQNRDRYLEKLIKAEQFDAFKSAVRKMGIDFPIDALDAFCNYPKNVQITEEMQDFFVYVLENCKYTERTDNCSTISDVAFHFYTDALLCNASLPTVHCYLNQYPVRLTHDDKAFCEMIELMIENRQDNAFEVLLKKKLKYDVTRVVDEKWLKYSDFSEYWKKTVYEVFHSIVFRYRLKEDDLRHDYSWTDKEKSKRLALRWLEALRSFVKLVPIEAVNTAVDECKYKLRKEAKTAFEFAVAEGVQNEEFLDLLR